MDRDTSQGFSLIEILLVIGIIAVLALAALLVFPQVQAARQAQQERENITHIAAVLKQAFLLRGYVDLNNDVSNASRAFPTNMNNGVYAPGQPISSSWGGAVTVGPGANTHHLRIVYSDVPPKVCLPFAKSLSSVFERVLVDTVVVRDNLTGVVVNYNVDNAIAACAGDEIHDLVVETQ